jgi:hypothetical protein
MKRFLHLLGVVTLTAVTACTSMRTTGASQAPVDSGAATIEDIYILRSLREQRATPTEFCAESKIGFSAKSEDRYVFKAVLTNARDGKVIDAISQPGGTLNACFESAPGVTDTNFYAEGVFAGVAAVGKGKCTPIAPDFPEPGITSVRCFLILSNLPAPYVGGVLTTNSVTSRQPVGADSNPRGYIQPSIATIRLWRKRG